MNEELRSATEELEASKEELQSLNEELATVNSELQSKVEESAKVNDDLQNLISLTGVATIFVDREMRIKRYTAPAETLFNVIPSDKGRPLLDLTHRLVYDSLGDDLRAAFESLKTAEREVRSTDGRWLLARVLPYRTDDDRIDGAILALIDITARRHAEHQARASEERLKLAALATHDFAIVVMDENGTVVSWNAGAQRIFGFTVDEMIGKPLDAIFTDADRASGVPEQERRRALARGRADDERWYVARDGTRLYCHGVLTRMEAPGFSGLAKIVHDATNQKVEESRQQLVLEEERTVRTEAPQLSRMKDEFIAVLAHELKNPLNLIHGKAEMLARVPEARNVSRIQEAADAIQRSAAAQAQIIDDLLDLSRVKTGKLSLRFAPTDVVAIVSSIVDALQQDALARGITLRLDVAAAPVVIRADAVRVEQIVWNLARNALKFSPRGGLVTLSVAQVGNDRAPGRAGYRARNRRILAASHIRAVPAGSGTRRSRARRPGDWFISGKAACGTAWGARRCALRRSWTGFALYGLASGKRHGLGPRVRVHTAGREYSGRFANPACGRCAGYSRCDARASRTARRQGGLCDQRREAVSSG
jgi:two-component system CheB/CheR fusion protein